MALSNAVRVTSGLTQFFRFTMMALSECVGPLFKQVEMDMTWEKPSFREVNMNSEIGAYQEDFNKRKPGDMPPSNSAADGITSGPAPAGSES
jgi:hypothetical protein